jgi:hypothetical protein
MRVRAAGKTVLVVLLNEGAGASRTLDATNVTRWLAGLAPLEALPAVTVASSAGRSAAGRLRTRKLTRQA